MNLKKDNQENHDISVLLENLDNLQNSQLLEEAKFLVDRLLAKREQIVPYLALQKRDSSFIHYFSYYFIPYCDTTLIQAMWEEFDYFFHKEDITEYTDLIIISSLIQKNVHLDKLNVFLKNKYNRIYNSTHNQHLILDYVEQLNVLNNEIQPRLIT